MVDPTDRHVEIWYRHIRALAHDIGPRGSATDGERRAAEYCAGVLADLGLAPQVETFVGARSAWQPHLIVAFLMLLSFALYPLRGRVSAWAAAVTALVALTWEVLELTFRPNPLRSLIATGSSQNVIAVLPPRAEHRQDLVLIGHVDTNRAALVFASNGWVNFWRVTAPVIFFSFCIQAGLYIAGAVTQWSWAWPASVPSAFCAALLTAICLQAESSPYSPGANDNASGAGLVLALAERLASEPLRYTRVWFVNTGCEETKHYGAIDFFHRHAAGFLHPAVVVFEMLARDGPAWLEREVIIPPFAYRADPGLVALVQRLAATCPEWRVSPVRILGGHTEMADALRLGIPALTLIGIGPDGAGLGYKGPPLYWHQLGDTIDQVDRQAMARNYGLAWAFVQAFDASSARRSYTTIRSSS